MPPTLAPAIARYFSAANELATARVAECFTEHATVRDEGKTLQGIKAIQDWMVETNDKYHHVMEPLSAQQAGQQTIVLTRMTGAFPGSPIEVQFHFVLGGGRIAELAIG